MDFPDSAPLFASIDTNVRLGTVGLDQSLTAANLGLARQQNVPALTLTRVSALLLAAQYEARLNWLTWHPWSRLEDEQRTSSLSGGISARWDKLLRSALVMRLGALNEPIEIVERDVPSKLPPPYRGIYYDLRRVRKLYLDPLIDNRSSLAHGEWAVALTRDASGLNRVRTQRISGSHLVQGGHYGKPPGSLLEVLLRRSGYEGRAGARLRRPSPKDDVCGHPANIGR